MKYFSNLNKSISIDANITASRVLSRDVAVIETDVEVVDSALQREQTVFATDYALATTSNIDNNYDENNGLPDATIDWDQITIADGIYTAGDYDSNTYDIPDAQYIDQYTLEDDKITVTKT